MRAKEKVRTQTSELMLMGSGEPSDEQSDELLTQLLALQVAVDGTQLTVDGQEGRRFFA